ncbi:PREDICTED: PC3-like endoprotease variant B [Priapulus caudatus]|uniref:PC3-like endoprotease variant B n=1 Tax=Priapulus caudatus TaxID=37621 RepID=A0ABM1E5J5_PRICU|nr:PREDICTED: PC3-like endoprotease variant B [Priapulus caudatus]
MNSSFLTLVAFLFVRACRATGRDSEEELFTNSFVIEFGRNVDEEVVQLVGESLRIPHLHKVMGFDNVYHFMDNNGNKRSRREVTEYLTTIKSNPHVEWVEQQKLLIREKRNGIAKFFSLPSLVEDSAYQRVQQYKSNVTLSQIAPVARLSFQDPNFHDQWYLCNTGQTGGPPGYDLNIESAWSRGYSGRGVVICILDDGVDHSHPDLVENYDAEASYDFNDLDDVNHDPTPRNTVENGHGTRCAGEVAAVANNTVCGVGVAFGARIGGVRMLDGEVTDVIEAQALLFHNQHVDIYSTSWGPTDNGRTMDRPGRLMAEALRRGVAEGRGGKGSVYLWAAGNGGSADDCNADGYASSVYTLTVGSVTDRGRTPYYAEPCSAMLAVVFTGGAPLRPSPRELASGRGKVAKIVTTDLNHGCTKDFQGTSSAAPLAAGIVALALQSNPDLTWRDVQHIVVATARIPSPDDDDDGGGWWENGAGRHSHTRYGFGVMDASHVVETARTWRAVAPQHTCAVTYEGGARCG